MPQPTETFRTVDGAIRHVVNCYNAGLVATTPALQITEEDLPALKTAFSRGDLGNPQRFTTPQGIRDHLDQDKLLDWKRGRLAERVRIEAGKTWFDVVEWDIAKEPCGYQVPENRDWCERILNRDPSTNTTLVAHLAWRTTQLTLAVRRSR